MHHMTFYPFTFQDGIGRIKIVEKGVELDGMALFMDSLRTSHIKSR